MTRCVCGACAVSIFLWVSACSEPIDNPTCSYNSDCKTGHLCKEDGTCEKAEPVSINPTVLPDALIGDSSYRQPLQAEHGFKPYSWSMVVESGADKLSWLMIDAGTGELRAKAGQAPAEAARDLMIEVTVRDRSNGGEGDTDQRKFGLSIIECRAPVVCYEDEQGQCLEGIRDCVDGMLSAECTSKQPSNDADHCGPGCGACGPLGDRCEAGECRCGSRDPCAAGETCCGTGCYDLSSDTSHCGGCDLDCADQTANAGGVFCDGGECDYVTCEAGHLDCDNNRQNGCETLSDRNNCSACGDDCASQGLYPNTTDQSCVAGACEYDCETGYADCDTQSAGCETQLGTGENCSGCGDACTTPGAPACIVTGGGEVRCGCTQDTDCAEDRMCCSTQTCVIHSPQNCESCGHACDILEGGLECLGDAGTGWSCGCETREQCEGVYTFTEASCPPSTHRCNCEGVKSCAGTVDDMCCYVGVSRDCVDLNTDPSNCGVCGRICPSGTCVDGSCTCGTCPNLSGEAWKCVSGSCVCTNLYGTPDDEPCSPGQYCCTNKGCCMKECGVAVLEECSIGCLNEGYVWCRWGCCSRCVDETQCDQYEPSGFPFYP